MRESTALRNRLITEAHEAILEEFKARYHLGTMALDRARNSQRSPLVLTLEKLDEVIGRMAPPAAASRDAQIGFMSLWQKLVPEAPDRVILMRTLSRSTTITGRMLDGIAGGDQLSVPAKWLTTGGRTLWALVEISVPHQHWGTLLGKYWQSLLLLISLILIASGLFTGLPSVYGFGWAVLGIVLVLIVLRTILWDFMRDGHIRAALGGVAIVIAVALAIVGGVQAKNWMSDKLQRAGEWAEAQVCQRLGNCSTQSGLLSPPVRR